MFIYIHYIYYICRFKYIFFDSRSPHFFAEILLYYNKAASYLISQNIEKYIPYEYTFEMRN